MQNPYILRAELFGFQDNFVSSYVHYEDGGLLIEDGVIQEVMPFKELATRYPMLPIIHEEGKLVMPGFIDTHIHFPQKDMIASYGKKLLDWLSDYTFPTEAFYQDDVYAKQQAKEFISRLLTNGTTSCVAYSSSHYGATDALFDAASHCSMAMFAGQVWMDRNCPNVLSHSVATYKKETSTLIADWHHNGRNRYVLTPRFAISCTPDLLSAAGEFIREMPDLYVQTHISENLDEIRWTMELFPGCKDYLHVYESYGLLTSKTFLGHGIHLSDDEWKRISAMRSVVTHCPTSNLFLGSGLFPMAKAKQFGVRTTIASDVGAGTSFSLLKTLGEAYKIQSLLSNNLDPFDAFFQITYGAGAALGFPGVLGALVRGAEADLVVIDCNKKAAEQERTSHFEQLGTLTLKNKLFGLMIQGDERNIDGVYIHGAKIHDFLRNSSYL